MIFLAWYPVPMTKADLKGETIDVGYTENNPMCYTDARGKPAGLFVDILNYIALQEDWQLVYHKDSWPEHQKNLRKGNLDILVPMAISEERMKFFEFNQVDAFNNWAEIYISRDSPIKSLLDLNGKRVASNKRGIFTTGPEGILHLREKFQLDTEIIGTNSYSEASQLVANNKADAAVLNRMGGARLAEQFGLVKSGIVFSPVRLRFGLNKHSELSPLLARAIDFHLAELKEDQNSIYHQSIMNALGEHSIKVEIIPRWLLLTMAGLVILIVITAFFVFLLNSKVKNRTRELRNANISLVQSNEHLTKEIAVRLETETALRENEKKYRDLFEESKDTIYITNRDGSLADINQAGLDLFGFSKEEMGDQNIRQYFQFPDEQIQLLQQIEEEGFIKDREIVLKNKNGSRIDCLVSASMRRDKNGQCIGYQGILRDISKRVELENQLRQVQKLESVGTLAGGIAHEFNNLLSPILGYTALLKEKIADERQEKEELDQIFIAGQRAAALVRQILAFSRKSISKKHHVDMGEVLQEALSLLKHTIPATISIQHEIDSNLPKINASPQEILQVITNLCVNASHAMPDLGTLSINLKNGIPGKCSNYFGKAIVGPFIELSIADTGHGIDATTMAHIFEPFYTTKDTGKGTGLGLSVVLGIVEQHGGHISVESEVGKGTKFCVCLPIETGPEHVSPSPEKLSVLYGNERILLVDDELMVTKVISKMLETLGYQVASFTDHLEFLSVFREQSNNFDLLISDYTMPKINGKMLVDQVKEIRSDIPIMLMTGYNNAVTEENVQSWGIDALLMKPAEIADLSQKVRRILDRKTS
ncbi:MAG: PAS domain S-box protein [SAR324 cluster bacterium]|nr:PAS domain S-box protein [SAR324 cluster bacterium]